MPARGPPSRERIQLSVEGLTSSLLEGDQRESRWWWVIQTRQGTGVRLSEVFRRRCGAGGGTICVGEAERRTLAQRHRTERIAKDASRSASKPSGSRGLTSLLPVAMQPRSIHGDTGGVAGSWTRGSRDGAGGHRPRDEGAATCVPT